MESVAPLVDTPKAVVIAGLIGSLLSLSFVDQMGKRQRLVAVASGMVMAHYLAPLIANLFHEENYQETIGFLVGLFGMSVVASVFRAIQNSDLWGLIKRRYGNSTSPEAPVNEEAKP